MRMLLKCNPCKRVVCGTVLIFCPYRAVVAKNLWNLKPLSLSLRCPLPRSCRSAVQLFRLRPLSQAHALWVSPPPFHPLRSLPAHTHTVHKPLAHTHTLHPCSRTRCLQPGASHPTLVRLHPSCLATTHPSRTRQTRAPRPLPPRSSHSSRRKAACSSSYWHTQVQLQEALRLGWHHRCLPRMLWGRVFIHVLRWVSQ